MGEEEEEEGEEEEVEKAGEVKALNPPSPGEDGEREGERKGGREEECSSSG